MGVSTAPAASGALDRRPARCARKASARFTTRSGALAMRVEAMQADAATRPAQALASARRCRVVVVVGIIAIVALVMMCRAASRQGHVQPSHVR